VNRTAPRRRWHPAGRACHHSRHTTAIWDSQQQQHPRCKWHPAGRACHHSRHTTARWDSKHRWHPQCDWHFTERACPQPAHDSDVGQPAATASTMQIASSGKGMSPQPAHDSKVGQPAALATAMQIGIQREEHDTTAGTRQQGRAANSDHVAQMAAIAGCGERSEGEEHGREGEKRSERLGMVL
jgi:hypothetical protein